MDYWGLGGRGKGGGKKLDMLAGVREKESCVSVSGILLEKDWQWVDRMHGWHR